MVSLKYSVGVADSRGVVAYDAPIGPEGAAIVATIMGRLHGWHNVFISPIEKRSNGGRPKGRRWVTDAELDAAQQRQESADRASRIALYANRAASGLDLYSGLPLTADDMAIVADE